MPTHMLRAILFITGLILVGLVTGPGWSADSPDVDAALQANLRDVAKQRKDFQKEVDQLAENKRSLAQQQQVIVAKRTVNTSRQRDHDGEAAEYKAEVRDFNPQQETYAKKCVPTHREELGQWCADELARLKPIKRRLDEWGGRLNQRAEELESEAQALAKQIQDVEQQDETLRKKVKSITDNLSALCRKQKILVGLVSWRQGLMAAEQRHDATQVSFARHQIEVYEQALQSMQEPRREGESILHVNEPCDPLADLPDGSRNVPSQPPQTKKPPHIPRYRDATEEFVVRRIYPCNACCGRRYEQCDDKDILGNRGGRCEVELHNCVGTCWSGGQVPGGGGCWVAPEGHPIDGPLTP